MNKVLKNIGNWLLSILIAFIFVFLLKTFIGMPTTVNGASMVPTFFSDEKLILSTWSANLNKTPNRGDIITFEAPSVSLIRNANKSNPVAIYGKSNRNFYENILYYGLGISKNSYIKRVIGVAGDHIEIKNEKVYLNGEPINEDYIRKNLKTDMSLGGEFDDITVPDGYIFVLGDNRTSSADSRRFGCIPVDKIQGKVVCRWWPIGKFKKYS